MPKQSPQRWANSNFCGRTRREFLWQTGAGFTGTALAAILGDEGFLASQTRAADGVSKSVRSSEHPTKTAGATIHAARMARPLLPNVANLVR